MCVFVRCTLFVVCCLLYVLKRLHVWSCVCCLLLAIRCVLSVVCCLLLCDVCGVMCVVLLCVVVS